MEDFLHTTADTYAYRLLVHHQMLDSGLSFLPDEARITSGQTSNTSGPKTRPSREGETAGAAGMAVAIDGLAGSLGDALASLAKGTDAPAESEERLALLREQRNALAQDQKAKKEDRLLALLAQHSGLADGSLKQMVGGMVSALANELGHKDVLP